MESLHGVLMHGDEQVGDAHAKEHRQMKNKDEEHTGTASVKVRRIKKDYPTSQSDTY